MTPRMARLVLLLAIVCCATAFGQKDAGELRLAVRDASGGGVGASVELANEAGKIHKNLVLPPTGDYDFKNLPFGFYRLLITQPGFAPSSELIEIRSEVPLTHQVTLGVQPVESAVVVKQSETLVDPNRTSAAYYVGAQEIQDRQTGLAGRGLLDLVVRQPGWTLEANGILHPRESEYETQYIVDGFPIQDNRSPAFAPSMDAGDVQSMKIYTSGIPAEFGQKLGGVIEITTDQNNAPGFHGTAAAQGGSFDTAGGFLSLQDTRGKTTGALSAQGFLTDRYLDPPVIDNFTNHASSTSITGSLDHDFSPSDSLRLSVSHAETWFQVPNELIQEAAGQRQDRTSADNQGEVSYQHIFSPNLLGSVRGMVRDVSADLWSNPFATPISAEQDRGFRQGYLSGSLAGHWGRNEWKIGSQDSWAAIQEQFGYHILAYNVKGVQIFDPDTPPDFDFKGNAPDREQSAYAQDLIRLGNFTVSAGLRFDHYHLLVDETALSPRLGVSWSLARIGLLLHASYDRTFGTPPIENLLVSASPQAQALSGTAFYLPLRPSRGNYYEVGLTQAIRNRLRLDASYFVRDIQNYEDDDLLENTGVSFPIAFASARIRGVEAKLEAPRWGKLSGFLSYAHTVGVGRLPIVGGLFLDNDAQDLLSSNSTFPVSQDQRNTARALIRYQIVPRLWVSGSASYNSGLPVEDIPGEQTFPFLIAQYGADVVNSVNFDRGRVHPWFSLDASAGADLWKHEQRKVSIQVDALNLTNRLNVINFAGLLSGTAISPPRSFGMRLRLEF